MKSRILLSGAFVMVSSLALAQSGKGKPYTPPVQAPVATVDAAPAASTPAGPSVSVSTGGSVNALPVEAPASQKQVAPAKPAKVTGGGSRSQRPGKAKKR
ncbi:MAG: hypothetical protein JNL72_06235 [Flavipsychrobacter sp.]|nr:hypothetical protein [Flavipsychrobacter sp.]